jgi:hypothetical protein
MNSKPCSTPTMGEVSWRRRCFYTNTIAKNVTMCSTFLTQWSEGIKHSVLSVTGKQLRRYPKDDSSCPDTIPVSLLPPINGRVSIGKPIKGNSKNLEFLLISTPYRDNTEKALCQH